MIEALQGKNEQLNALGKELAFRPGVIRSKCASVLGDLRDAEAVPALLAELKTAEAPGSEIAGLEGVIEARARATQMNTEITPEVLNDPQMLQQFDAAQQNFAAAIEILEEVLLNTMYDLPGRTDIGKVVIDAQTVDDNPVLGEFQDACVATARRQTRRAS